MPARKPKAKPDAKPVDDLETLRVEIFAALGETSLKAEGPLKRAGEIAARLHDQLEHLVKVRPELKHTLDVVPGDSLYVPEEYEDGGRLRRAPAKPRLGFTSP